MTPSPQQRLERLRKYATWSAEDMREFTEALVEQRSVETDAWR
jgi:hypothetical protein